VVSEELISPNQIAFIKGRYILESVVPAHEVIHDAVHRGQLGFIFKLDYEKAYDRVDRDFLLKVMRMRGFSPRWMSIIEGLLHKDSVGVRINDCNSQFFLTSRGVSQGDPISPILFNFMADVFTKVLFKAAGDRQIAGLMQELGGGEIINMQYADDTLLFLENKLQSVINLKWILACFQHMSGMRINFHKFDLVPINLFEEDAQLTAQSLSCKQGEFPMNYLGVPLHHSKLRKEDIQHVVDKILKKSGGWRGKFLNHAAKLELVRSVLASIPFYLLSVIKFPKWAITLINSQMAHCIWDNYEGHHKYHLANWGLVTKRRSMEAWAFLIYQR
jgi:hypothetical protein